VTITLLPGDVLVVQPNQRPTVRNNESSVQPPEGGAPGVPGFTADSWVFLADTDTDWTVGDQWGLGFGPVGTAIPRWWLFHCMTEDSVDSRRVFLHRNPSNHGLLRWTTSVVGQATATLLLERVGSCVDFYRRYFTERPDLQGPVDPGDGGTYRSTQPTADRPPHRVSPRDRSGRSPIVGSGRPTPSRVSQRRTPAGPHLMAEVQDQQ
jgi:hypothetical protein